MLWRAHDAQKGSPAKKTGHTILVAAQYSQESPENNELFVAWLALFEPIRPAQALWASSGG
jgi:hypothetical protein